MSVKRRVGLAWMAMAALVSLDASGASAQGVTDPGDLAFWQSVQNSRNPAELRAYLQVYPTGRFAELARVRIAALDGGAAPAAGPGPAPGPAPVVEPETEYSITLTPPSGRVGQRFRVACVNFPEANSYDQLVVVPAGTPVVDPRRGRDENRVLWYAYAAQCPNGPEAGPFAPGAYEIRWMSTLFNNDNPARYEMKAKTAFSVR